MRKTIIVAFLLVLARTAYAAPNSAPSLEMVHVKGGCYQMGDIFGDGRSDEKPVHEVCVSDFNIGKYHVTQAQWVAVMKYNPSHFLGENRPVEYATWDDVQAFIAQFNTTTGKNYRLPTEAEWEYAARGGGKKEEWAGTNDVNKLGDFAWFKANSEFMSNEVGAKKPNGLGLYDMTGNVWEWCQDIYGENYYKESVKDNPTGPTTGPNRVLRGGGWYDPANVVRTAYRLNILQSYRDFDPGFRLVLPLNH